MPVTTVRGVPIGFDDYGSGEPVVLITGTGGRGREWSAHQVPALTSAGYRVVTIDNRGVPPSGASPASAPPDSPPASPPDFTLADMADDVAGLIGTLELGPCRVVGFSLGGIITLEGLLKYPELYTQAVIMGTRGRTDALRIALSEASAELEDSGVSLPPRYAATVRAMQYLSPQTLSNEQQIRDWLDIFELSPADVAISRAQRGLDLIGNRLAAYAEVTTSCLVVAFADDLIVPPFFCRELADAIPGSKYEEVPGCGHYGHLEQPDAVNELILGFFAGR